MGTHGWVVPCPPRPLPWLPSGSLSSLRPAPRRLVGSPALGHHGHRGPDHGPRRRGHCDHCDHATYRALRKRRFKTVKREKKVK